MLSQPTPPFHALNCTDVMFIRKGYAGMAERMMYTRSFLDMVVSRCSTGHRIGDVRRKGELAGMGKKLSKPMEDMVKGAEVHDVSVNGEIVRRGYIVAGRLNTIV